MVGTPVGGIPDFLCWSRGETSADFKVSLGNKLAGFVKLIILKYRGAN